LSDKVYLFDIETGSIIWAYKSPYADEGRTAPVLDEVSGTIFAIFDGGVVTAVDYNNGGEKWVRMIATSPGTNPVLSGTSLFVMDQLGNVLSINKANGSTIWKRFYEVYNTKGCMSLSPKSLFVGLGESVYSLNPSNGQINWKNNPGIGVTGSMGAVDDRRYYFSTNDAVYALDTNTGSMVWTRHLNEDNMTNFVTLHDKYAITSGKRIYCLKRETGEIVWEMDADAETYGPLTIDSNTAYLGHISNLGIYALRLPETRANKWWSMFRCDVRNTGYLP
jgi:outer membrane protein assembly factor BamB